MLKRAALVIAMTIAILASVDFVSSLLVPGPCLIEKIISTSSEQNPKNENDQRTCTYQEGLIIEGISYIFSWKPEVWTAIGTLVIAAFTTILGLFTVGLARSTRIAAEAADLSARAAIALELPVIRIEPRKCSYGASRKKDGSEIHYLMVGSLVFSNLGRTKAFPTEIKYGWTVGDELPKEPTYRCTHKFILSMIFEPNPGSAPEVYLADALIEIPEDGYEQIRTGKLNMWFYSQFSYLDFMQARHEIGMCWRRQETFGNSDFLEDDTPAYNQKT